MRGLFILLVFVCSAVHADVYKSINADGEVVYSDVPSKDSRRMEMPQSPAYTPPPVPVAGKVERKVVANDFYKSFVMTKPANETTLRNNLGIVMLETALTPSLQTRLRHRVQFYLDGNPHGTPSDRTAVTMSDIDRGEHRLSASVIDPDGSVLASTTDTTIYVKRESELHEKDAIDKEKPNIPRDEFDVTNPGFRTENPNKRTEDPNIRHRAKDIKDVGEIAPPDDTIDPDSPANPGFRNRNPNILSTNPNMRSTNPNIINPTKPPPPTP